MVAEHLHLQHEELLSAGRVLQAIWVMDRHKQVSHVQPGGSDQLCLSNELQEVPAGRAAVQVQGGVLLIRHVKNDFHHKRIWILFLL